MATPDMHKMSYPIETPEAYKFWGSRHKCNRLKAIVAFSMNIKDANYNLRRFGYNAHLRLRALLAYQQFVAQPDMVRVPFTPASIPWWDCLPHAIVPPEKGRWALWDDSVEWDDTHQWVEWIPDPDPVP